MNIEIFRQHGKLERRRYSFHLLTSLSFPIILNLQHYARETKPTARHRKWTAVEEWSRYSNRYIPKLKTKLEIPSDVIEEALETARDSIEFRPPESS